MINATALTECSAAAEVSRIPTVWSQLLLVRHVFDLARFIDNADIAAGLVHSLCVE